MRKFEIHMQLNGKPDVRDVAPMIKGKTDPMSGQTRTTPPIGRSIAAARPAQEGG